MAESVIELSNKFFTEEHFIGFTLPANGKYSYRLPDIPNNASLISVECISANSHRDIYIWSYNAGIFVAQNLTGDSANIEIALRRLLLRN